MTITYKKIGLNEFSHQDTIINFAFTFNTYESPIREPIAKVDLDKIDTI